MSTIETAIPRDDLRHFHEMSLDEQAAEWESNQEYLAIEAEQTENLTIYPYLEAVNFGLSSGKLQWVEPQTDDYRIVLPIRDRNQIPLEEDQGSLPILHSHSASILSILAKDVKAVGSDDNELMTAFDRNGITDWRLSVTSLLRTTVYQRVIAKQGRMAVGRDGSDRHSSHEKGVAFDIDHGGLYVATPDGQEVPINRKSNDANFAILSQALPAYRKVLRKVIGLYEDAGVVTALEEVPNGWGCWHIAAIPEAEAA